MEYETIVIDGEIFYCWEQATNQELDVDLKKGITINVLYTDTSDEVRRKVIKQLEVL